MIFPSRSEEQPIRAQHHASHRPAHRLPPAAPPAPAVRVGKGFLVTVVMVLVGAVGWFLTVMADVDALLERAYGLLPLAPVVLFVLVTALTAGLLRPVRR